MLEFVHEDLRAVESALVEGADSITTLIPQIAEYTFGGGGKRVRPALVLLGARLFGYAGPRAIRIAACAEWLHSASLLHDDVVDQASVRRGRPSANARFGAREAVLAGDFIYSVLCRALVEDGNREILSRFAQTIGEMAEGEVLQLGRSFELDIDEDTYLQVIGSKTSSLLATAIESGAILAEAKPDERRAAREYGWQLGLAFQLVDDALDYSGTREELGKAPLTDLAEGKVTLPLLLALRRASHAARAELAARLEELAAEAGAGREPSPRSMAQVAERVRRYGGVEATLERARARVDEAIAQLEAFEDGPARRALAGLARFVVARRR